MTRATASTVLSGPKIIDALNPGDFHGENLLPSIKKVRDKIKDQYGRPINTSPADRGQAFECSLILEGAV